MSDLRQRIYDRESGEVIRDEEFKPGKNKIHYHYYLTFYSTLAKADIDITGTTHAILGQMDSKNKIVLDKNKLETLRNNYYKTPNAFKKAAGKMCNEGLMQRIAPATYFANPYYFSKTNVNKLAELRKEYSELLFSTKQKTKTTEKSRIKNLEKQIEDILRK